MIYLIGSKALSFWFPSDKESDFDIVSDEDIKSSPSLKVDVAPNDLPLFTVCEQYSSGETIETPVGMATVVNPLGLRLIKRSHLHRPIGFEKHIRHYHFLKPKCEPDENYQELLRLLITKTKEK